MSQSSSKYNTMAINPQNSLHQDIPQIVNFRNPFHSPNIFSFNVSNRPSENPSITSDAKSQGLNEIKNLDSFRNQDNNETMGIKSAYSSNRNTYSSKYEQNQEIEHQMKAFIKNQDKENIPISPNGFFISPSAQRRLTEEFENEHLDTINAEKSNPNPSPANNFPIISHNGSSNDNNHIVSAEFGQLKEPFGSDKMKKTPNNRYSSHIGNDFGTDVQPFTPMNSEQTKPADREPRDQGHISERSTSRNSSRRRMKPIVVLNIDIGKGNKAELQVYENDSAEEVAQKFCENHALPTKVCKVLAKNIQAQIDNFYKIKAERASKKIANNSHSFMDDLSNCSIRETSTADKTENLRGSVEEPMLPKYNNDTSFQNQLSKLNPDDFFGPIKRESQSSQSIRKNERKNSETEDRITPSANHKHYQVRPKEPTQQSTESVEKYSTNEQSEAESLQNSTQTPRVKPREQAAAEHYEKWTNYLSDKKNTSNRKNIISKSPGNYFKQSNDKEYIISPTQKITGQPAQRSFSSKSARTLQYSDQDDSPFNVNSQFQTAKRAIFDRLYEDGVHQKKMKETFDYIRQKKRESEELTGATFCPKISPASIDIARAKTLRIETDNSLNATRDKKRKVKTPSAKSKETGMSFNSDHDDSRHNNSSFSIHNAHSRLYEDARLKHEKMKTVQADNTRFGTFKPTLCKESVKMTSRGRDLQDDPIFMRLYKEGLERKKSLSQKKEQTEENLEYDEKTGQKLFQPKINKNSKYYKPDVYLQKNKIYDVNGSDIANAKRPKTPGAKKSSTLTNKEGNKTPTHKIDLYRTKSTLKGVISPTSIKNTLEHIVPPAKINKPQSNQSYTATVSLSSKSSTNTKETKPGSKTPKSSIKEETKPIPAVSSTKRLSEESNGIRRDPYPSKKSSAALDVGTQLLSQIFIVLDSDGDGYISAESVDVSKLSPEILDCISDVLFDLENDLTLAFKDFARIAEQYKVVDKLIQLYGFPSQGMESPDKAFLSTEDGEGYDSYQFEKEKNNYPSLFAGICDNHEEMNAKPYTPTAKNTKQTLLTKKYKEILEKSMKNC